MKRLVLLAAAVVLAVAMPVSAPAAPAHPCPHPHLKWADLDVSNVTIHIPGRPTPYLVENRDGSTQHFDVHVDIKNIGGAAACPSRLAVVFDQDLVIVKARHLTVPHLAPGQAVTIVVDVPHLKLQGLFPLEIIADVNRNKHVPELNHHNNLDAVNPDTPVIARFWKVTRWSVHGHEPAPPFGGLSDDFTDRTDPGFYFKYSRYDTQRGGFLYNAYGGITEDRDLSGKGPGGSACSGTGTGHASHSPWLPSTFLGINYSETRYLASMDTKADHYTTTITCNPGGTNSDPNTDFTDLQTYPSGPLSTNQGDKQLTGGPVTESFNGATFIFRWTFDAEVP